MFLSQVGMILCSQVTIFFSPRIPNQSGGSAVLREVCQEGFGHIETQGEWVKLQVYITTEYVQY